MFNLAEAFHARHSTIVERPAPAEVGGFAIRLDDEFSTAFANAEAIPESIAVTETGYRSLLGRVDGNLYVGRTAAGGMGSRIDLDNDGKTDVSFSSPWKAFTVLPSYGVKVDFYCVLTAGIYKGMNSNVVTHDCL